MKIAQRTKHSPKPRGARMPVREQGSRRAHPLRNSHGFAFLPSAIRSFGLCHVEPPRGGDVALPQGLACSGTSQCQARVGPLPTFGRVDGYIRSCTSGQWSCADCARGAAVCEGVRSAPGGRSSSVSACGSSARQGSPFDSTSRRALVLKIGFVHAFASNAVTGSHDDPRRGIWGSPLITCLRGTDRTHGQA